MTAEGVLGFLAAEWPVLATILLLVACSAFFSMAETALVNASQARMHALEANGDDRARLVTELNTRQDRLIGTLLLGKNIVNILAATLAAELFIPSFGWWGVLYATLTMTFLLVIFSDVLPKSWAVASPDRLARAMAPVARFFVVVLGPISSLVNRFVRIILGSFGYEFSTERPMLTAHEELRGAVDFLHREGAVVKADRDLLGGVLDLGELEVSDIMVHRTSMRGLNADDPPAVNVRAVLESPYTRMPVWRGATDNIIGVVHAKDLLRALAEPDVEPDNLDISRITQKPWFVPDTTNLKDQLNAFLRRKAHFAIVVDEYGEVQGLVTLEDILEEIVGDISDEHDLEIQGVRQEADGSVVVDGSVPIRDLNRALDWNLPDEEATTVAGLVIHESRTIPEERQAFTFYDKRFIVMKRVKNRITQLRIRPAEDVVMPPPLKRGEGT
ncbi:HlyC/CorC family transporter [Pararhizobium sp. O133]|uniref:HlyC/CorC family transporter n=1 Tax=Pararhizobium sp. O133 TaxID=3449278 RepID=UPI003F68635B